MSSPTSRGVVIGSIVAAVALVTGLVFVTTRGDDDSSSPSTTFRQSTTVAASTTATPTTAQGSTTTTATTATTATVAPTTTVVASTTSAVVDGDVDGEIVAQNFDTALDDAFTPGVERVPGSEITVALPVLELSATVEPDAGTSLLGARGSQLGLYGGVRDAPSCDSAVLVDFLTSDPVAGAAWSAAQGIEPTGLQLFVDGLTSAVLTRDTRVTSSRYVGGADVAHQRVLRAGTPVLLDGYGIARVSCPDGNPLAPHEPTAVPPTYAGTWPGFDPTQFVAVVAEDAVTEFLLVDLTTGLPFLRSAGVDGADADVDMETWCWFVPDDPACSEPPPEDPDDPGLAAITVLDEQLSFCGYVIDEYIDNGPVDGGYSIIALTRDGEAEFIVRDDFIDVNDQVAADIAVECGFYQP